LEKRDNELKETNLQREGLLKEQDKIHLKMEEMTQEKDQHVAKTKQQI
jgi:hypothetical protein